MGGAASGVRQINIGRDRARLAPASRKGRQAKRQEPIMTAPIIKIQWQARDVIDCATKPNPFQNCRLLSTSAPTVTVTNYKFDAPALVSAIVAWRGLLHVFSSREVELRAEHDEAMKSALRDRSIGKALGQIKGQNFGGYCIKPVDDEQGRTIWWVTHY
jgi:hypothetical protein